MEIGRVDHGRYDLGVGQGFQSLVSDVHRMLYRSVPVGVFVYDGRQYFRQMVPSRKSKTWASRFRENRWRSGDEHSLVCVSDVSLKNFSPPIGFDTVLDIVAGKCEKRFGPHYAQHQIESRQPGKQPLPGRRISKNGWPESVGQNQFLWVLWRSTGSIILTI